jgi:hypothetical protein
VPDLLPIRVMNILSSYKQRARLRGQIEFERFNVHRICTEVLRSSEGNQITIRIVIDKSKYTYICIFRMQGFVSAQNILFWEPRETHRRNICRVSADRVVDVVGILL